MARAIGITAVVGCGNGCGYCPQETFVSAYRTRSDILVMSFDLFRTCIDKIPEDTDVYFAGFSEPWQNPNLARMMLYAHQRGHRIALFTSLTGMTVADLEQLRQIPFLLFSVHLLASEKRFGDAGLSLLRALQKSGIAVQYLFYGRSLRPEIGEILQGADVRYHQPNSRGGNVKIVGTTAPKRKRGVIGCGRLHHNVLLPNGDVLICCVDWGMRHVLGNLLEAGYTDLFEGEAFRAIVASQKDAGSPDTLCRYCTDEAAFDVSLSARIFNSWLPKIRKRLSGLIP